MLSSSDIVAASYWTPLINLIISSYFDEGSTTCIFWNKNIEFQLADQFNSNQFVNIWLENLSESLLNDIYDFSLKEEELQKKNLYYNALIIKLTIAIDASKCESFIVFQEDIKNFSSAFRNATTYAKWHPRRSKFLFCYRKDIANENYFEGSLFYEQSNILIIEAETEDSSFFQLKTNKFVGPFKENPAELQIINTFNAITETFLDPGKILYPDKLEDLKGREIVIAAFDYRPFVAFDTEKLPQVIDRALDNPKGTLYIDGTEVRIVITFCEVYNCTVQVDSSEKEDWGEIYENGTGKGLLYMAASRQADIAVGAIYTWETDYADITRFLGRSGITCLVPKPARLTSWILPLKPFQPTLWLGVFVCLILESCALLVTYYAELLLVLGVDNKNWSKSSNFGIATTFKIFLSQGINTEIISLSVRTVLFSCFMIDIILTSIYSGGLASILTIPTLAEAADSVERLHKFRIPWTGSSKDWIFGIQETDEPFMKELLEMFRVYSFDEMRELAKTENMGFITERMTFGHFSDLDFLTQQSLDRLKLMVNDIYFEYCVGSVPRLWAFLPKMDKLILKWHSSGLNKFWEWKVSAEFLNGNMQKQIGASMSITADNGPAELDLPNFIGIIMIWCFGTLISCIAFCAEISYNRYQQRKLQKTSEVRLKNIV